jgi:hypothetical protein
MSIFGVEGLAFAVTFSFLIVLIHYEGLRLISYIAQAAPLTPRLKMLVVIMGVLAAHMVEAAVFALGYWLGAEILAFGRFVGDVPTTFFQFYYFALETYTTESVGDLYPVGALRVMASLEPLVGLILIGWSTSLTFVLMRRYWRVTPRRRY